MVRALLLQLFIAITGKTGQPKTMHRATLLAYKLHPAKKLSALVD
jgi:hypothetical protein